MHTAGIATQLIVVPLPKKLKEDFVSRIRIADLDSWELMTDIFFVCGDWQVLNQDETPFLHSLVFGEGVVNDATSVVLFNAIQKFDLSEINSTMAFTFVGNFFYLFVTSTLLGVLVSFDLIRSS